MKNQFTLATLISGSGRLGLALAGLMLPAIAASAAPAEVLPPSSPPYGLSYAEWSAKYWQWSLGQSTNHIELVGETGVCSGPGSRVRFLAAADIPGAGGVTIKTNHVVIGPGTPLFLTVLGAYDDNTGCPNFSSLTAAELADTNAANWTLVTETSCTIDGVAVPGLTDPATTEYLTISPPFSYTTAEKDNVLAGLFGEPCIPGGLTVYPAVAEGVYLMLSPFPPGRHTIHFVGQVTAGGNVVVDVDITYDITVL
jgi:hypothetical protein